MSRLAKKPISIPAGVTAELRDGIFGVKGPKGELKRPIPPELSIDISASDIMIRPRAEGRRGRIFSGTYASHIRNMLEGVDKGFEKKLEIEGVGFRAELKGSALSLNVGLSHSVIIEPRTGVTLKVEKNVITVSGADKEVVGDEAARIRRVREPEPYKGTGIRYRGEVIRRKSGKKVVASTA